MSLSASLPSQALDVTEKEGWIIWRVDILYDNPISRKTEPRNKVVIHTPPNVKKILEPTFNDWRYIEKQVSLTHTTFHFRTHCDAPALRSEMELFLQANMLVLN